MTDIIDKLRNIEIKEEIKNLIELIQTFFENYKETNSQKLRLIDTFIVFSFLIFCIQVVYVVFNGLDPMNSFLSGIMACVGTHFRTRWKIREEMSEALIILSAKSSTAVRIEERQTNNKTRSTGTVKYLGVLFCNPAHT